MADRICPECKRSDLRRSSRHGFMESFVWSLLGKYPWRCKFCGSRVLLRDRGERHRSASKRQAKPVPVTQP